eukprot:gene10225-11274_t
MSLRALEAKYGVPKSTISRWASESNRPRSFGPGRPTALSSETEKILVDAVKYLGKLGWPLDIQQIKFIIESFLKCIGENNIFPNNVPRDDWITGFRKRWAKELSLRRPEYVTIARAKGLTSFEVISTEVISTPPQNAELPKDSSTPKSLHQMTLRKAMRAAILQAIQPVQTNATASALKNAAKRRKRVQRNHGEVLTYEESIQRLKTEEEERKLKKAQKAKKAPAKGKENERKRKRLFEEDLCSVCKEDEPPCDSDEEGDIDWVS